VVNFLIVFLRLVALFLTRGLQSEYCGWKYCLHLPKWNWWYLLGPGICHRKDI